MPPSGNTVVRLSGFGFIIICIWYTILQHALSYIDALGNLFQGGLMVCPFRIVQFLDTRVQAIVQRFELEQRLVFPVEDVLVITQVLFCVYVLHSVLRSV